jgi:hypothetical protein
VSTTPPPSRSPPHHRRWIASPPASPASPRWAHALLQRNCTAAPPIYGRRRPGCVCTIWSGSDGRVPLRLSADMGRPPMGRPGSRPQRPGLSPGLLRFFFRKCPVNLIYLQTLKFHRIFSVNANWVIQVFVSSSTCYLSDGIGLISVGSL